MTFRSLVGATVAGLVADVLVVAPEPDALVSLCEPMGATVVSRERAEGALDAARGEWLLILEAGAQPLDGWDRAVATHLKPEARPARFEVTGEVEPFWRRLFGNASRPLLGGFLVPMRMARSAIRSASLERLPVGRAAVTLPASLRVAPAG